ncbi:hypothetical protein D3C87_33710 [compost metagenome]
MDQTISFLTGAFTSILIVIINNYFQRKRDLQQYNREIQKESTKTALIAEADHRNFMIESIEKVSQSLFVYYESISLTYSVIDSSGKMTLEDFDRNYKEDVRQLSHLKSLILSRFPQFTHKISKVINHHNNYWGHQRLLVLQGKNIDQESLKNIQFIIIEIQNAVREELDQIEDAFYSIATELTS